ncbi:perlucin-like [Ylistrum balloti]|uniref:perlucin-like n=1 Tax=Ylistrum balloti TaxID=509963 RepID=UPI0029058C68|nr:perlucin-like [Ylistrum balloti]
MTYNKQLGLVCALVIQVVRGCPNGWETFDGSCYFVSDITEDWSAASATCGVFHAHLAEVQNGYEDNFLKQLIIRYHNGHIQDRYFWFGGTDMFVEGDWRWSDSDQRLNYTNWRAGDPNDLNHAQDCMVADLNCNHYYWIDRECENAYNFVCEIRDGSSAAVIG